MHTLSESGVTFTVYVITLSLILWQKSKRWTWAETSSRSSRILSTALSMSTSRATIPCPTSKTRCGGSCASSSWIQSKSGRLRGGFLSSSSRSSLKFFLSPFKYAQKNEIKIIRILHNFLFWQLCLFANSRYTHVNYTWDNRIAFSHLFLKDWDPIREVDTYPPATGPMALYKVEEFFDTINFAVLGVSTISDCQSLFKYFLFPVC